LLRDDRVKFEDGERMSGVAAVDVSGLGKMELMQAVQNAQPVDRV
jgi:hypothetical protein